MRFVAVLLLALVDGQRASIAGHTISGRVVDASGGVPAGVGLTAWVRTSPTGSSGRPIAIAADGTFTCPPLSGNVYALIVGPSPDGPGNADVEGGVAVVRLTGADVTGVTIKTRRTTLRGRYVMRSANPRAIWPKSVHVTTQLVEPKDVPFVSGISEGAPNGEFVFRNHFGKRVLRVGYALQHGSHWWPDQVLLDGVDVTDVPTDFSEHTGAKLEVAFTQHPARITGTATLPDGSPAVGATVLTLAADPRLWTDWSSYRHAVQADRNGKFSVPTRPGKLLIVALPREVFSEVSRRQVNDARLGPLAKPIAVGARQARQIALQVVSMPR